MIDYHSNIVSALNTVLPTYYEMALTSKTKTPCLSFMELDNYALTEHFGATIGYNRIKYQIKVWGNDIGMLQKYAVKVDEVMRELGFKLVASGELYDNKSTMIQKILTFEALAVEEY